MRKRTAGPLIVGSGIAGLYVALRCRELGLRPVIITKSRLEESNTRYAQGGIAAAVGPADSPALHLRDTLRAGAGLVDVRAARVLTEEGPLRIADLVRYGVPFDTVEGHVSLGREGAHSVARILHAGGDATGLQIEETLRKRVVEEGIEARERTVLRRLGEGPDGELCAWGSTGDRSTPELLDGGPVVLATGGAGSLYLQSSNPAIATGEGVAIAFRAGALVSDLEFIQFHPTAFFRSGAPRHLISEALRGEGALLRNEAGERFMPRYHRDAELASRDIVTRAIHTEVERTRSSCVYLDATAIPRDRLFARFPTICRFLASYALDPSRDRVPVAPVAHYMVGGITTDLEGRSSLPGLLACGEVAATGVHGANRLASNSLLEAVVFGERVVRQLVHPTAGGPKPLGKTLHFPLREGEALRDDRKVVETVQRLLWESVGIVRRGPGLRSAVHTLEELSRKLEPERESALASPGANAVLTALLIARSALARTESRGAHYRSDYPSPRAAWRHHLGVRRGPQTALRRAAPG
ncbi:MAG: L-aspartate oxidase [Thermoplasmata archaeon]|nr:L-aspartate oxidase [Thermoplasmata archaeon]